MPEPDLRIRVGEVEFSNPCLTASGTYGFGERFPQVLNRLGGFLSPKELPSYPVRVIHPPESGKEAVDCEFYWVGKS